MGRPCTRFWFSAVTFLICVLPALVCAGCPTDMLCRGTARCLPDGDGGAIDAADLSSASDSR